MIDSAMQPDRVAAREELMKPGSHGHAIMCWNYHILDCAARIAREHPDWSDRQIRERLEPELLQLQDAIIAFRVGFFPDPVTSASAPAPAAL